MFIKIFCVLLPVLPQYRNSYISSRNSKILAPILSQSFEYFLKRLNNVEILYPLFYWKLSLDFQNFQVVKTLLILLKIKNYNSN